LKAAAFRHVHENACAATDGTTFPGRVILALGGALKDGAGFLRARHPAFVAATFQTGVVGDYVAVVGGFLPVNLTFGTSPATFSRLRR
jgi:hypothetical protein